ncbi:MAG: GGDEF domain-containing protein [Marinicellaceae bacterium]
MLMIADIDYFKRVNDKFGHQIVDEVLVTCAKRLKKHLGSDDLIARWGSEEFLILLRDKSNNSLDVLKNRAQQLQQIIGKNEMQLSTENITITITAGVSEHDGSPFDICLRNADQKLYQGKNSGRNRLIM